MATETQTSTSDSEPRLPGDDGVSFYTLQVRGSREVKGKYGWDDVATIAVPHRTKRRTIIQRALAEAGYNPDGGQRLTVRVLDEASARETPVGPKEQPLEWEIG